MGNDTKKDPELSPMDATMERLRNATIRLNSATEILFSRLHPVFLHNTELAHDLPEAVGNSPIVDAIAIITIDVNRACGTISSAMNNLVI